MRAPCTCRWAQERIAGYRGGWLSRSDAAVLGVHLQSCPVCVREVERDAALCEALSVLPRETTVTQAPSAWSSGARPRARGRAPSLALATAAAAAISFLLLSTHRGGSPPSTDLDAVPAIGVAPATGTASWKNAHDMVSLSDVSADPNRAMVLIYAHREHGARP